MRGNADQNNPGYGHFSRSVELYAGLNFACGVSEIGNGENSEMPETLRKLCIFKKFPHEGVFIQWLACDKTIVYIGQPWCVLRDTDEFFVNLAFLFEILLVSLLSTLNMFQTFFSISTTDFEQVNACWDCSKKEVFQ